MSEKSTDRDVQSPGPALDVIEQQERIGNLEADTALKLQTMTIAKAQVFIALLTVLVALGGVIVGAMTLYFDRHAPPAPHNTFIFLSPDHNTVL